MDRYDSQTTATWVTLIMNRPHGTWEETKVALIHARKDRGCAEGNPTPAAPPKIKQRSACPANGTAFRLHHIREMGHGSFCASTSVRCAAAIFPESGRPDSFAGIAKTALMTRNRHSAECRVASIRLTTV